ncbi:RHS repeat-associated core domain-containing protein [Bordetella bronchialis]|uniref:RHS repeat-associated core domain-containing protein n=1 Tax=Bordetella bronchialis TaxID=463025 RepID=UPI003D003C12
MKTKAGFTGAYRDPVALGYPLGNGYRWHMPGSMRFNAPDSFSPFGPGGINAYAYCAGDPVNRSDPGGHMPSIVSDIIEGLRRLRRRRGAVPADSLAAVSADAAATAPAASTSHELVPASSAGSASVPVTAVSPAVASGKKYVPIVETWHPRFKGKGRIMVEEDKIKLGRPKLTSHYSNTPVDEVFRAGGIEARNPNFPDNTIVFTNKLYDPHANDPYVAHYLPIPIFESTYAVGEGFRFEYFTISSPDGYALWKLGIEGWGDERIVLEHGKTPLSRVVAVRDRRGSRVIQHNPEFVNEFELSLPGHLKRAIEAAPSP